MNLSIKTTMNKRIVPFLFAVAFLAVSAARADDIAAVFSTFTVPVQGQITGHNNEKVSCKGPVRIAVMVQRDATMAQQSSIVTVDTTGLSCTGASSKASYNNTGHQILTRVFGAKDNVESPIAFFPATANGHLQARTGQVKLNLSYDTRSASLVHATATLTSL
ncbi:MAG TPA: hypothetical protein VGH20_10420 [Myxococcales bacterium]|jgi:hypothetical protein